MEKDLERIKEIKREFFERFKLSLVPDIYVKGNEMVNWWKIDKNKHRWQIGVEYDELDRVLEEFIKRIELWRKI